jgi:hypothetical protein
VSCGKIDHPVGPIDESTYLVAGEYKVTKAELYESFRLAAYTDLKELLDNAVIEDKVETLKSVLSDSANPLYLKATEWSETPVTTALWGTSDYKTLKGFSEVQKEIKIQTFVDALVILDKTLLSRTDEIKNTLYGLLDAYLALGLPATDSPYRVWGYPSEILTNYLPAAAKKLYAIDFLAADTAKEYLEDEEANPNYIKDTDLVNYYKNNLKGRYDVNAFIITFISRSEADIALQKHNLKSNSRGEWTFIPDPRVLTDSDYASGDYVHVQKILSDLFGEGYTLLPEDQKRISEKDYASYYSRYTVSETRTDGKPDSLLSPSQVLDAFVTLYNEVNPSTPVSPATAQKTYKYEDLAANTSLRSHIYTTLLLPEVEKNYKQYSPRIQSFGNYFYLAYKFDDASITEKHVVISVPNPEDEKTTLEIFINKATATQLDKYATDNKVSQSVIDAAISTAANFEQKAIEKVTESKFTDSYVSDKIAQLYKDLGIEIYDKTIYAYYNHNYVDSGAKSKTAKDNNLVAKIGDHKITVEALYNKLEANRGIQTAIDLLDVKILRDLYGSEITADNKEEYKKQFRNIITQFSQNQLESNGYPASMGRQNFLLLTFGATSLDEAYDKAFIQPKLKELFLADYKAHYGEAVYEKFAYLSAQQYDSYWSVDASHLLVYLDWNEDGTPDDPSEYYVNRFGESVTEAQKNSVRDSVAALVTEIYSHLGDYSYTSLPGAIEAIIKEYNSVSRISYNTISGYDDLEGNETATATWSQYRTQGLYLKYETLESINNQTNLPASAKYDQTFYERVVDISKLLNEYRGEDGKISTSTGIFPYLDFYKSWGSTVLNNADLLKVESKFGWHFILGNSVGYPLSAFTASSSDTAENPQYISEFKDYFGNKLTAYNDYEKLNAAQIQIYLDESATEYGVESLPGAVSTAITSYFEPIKTRYADSKFQSELYFRLALDRWDAKFYSNELDDLAAAYREINRRQISSYNSGSDYDAIWGGFFDILEGSAVVASDIKYTIGDPIPELLDYAKAFDSFDKELAVTVEPSSVNWNVAGIYDVTFDVAGGISKTIKVIVSEASKDGDQISVDRTAPTIGIEHFLNAETGLYQASYIITGSVSAFINNIRANVTATDNESGNLISHLQIIDTWVDYTREGTYTLILRAVDAAGNVKTASIEVEVVL